MAKSDLRAQLEQQLAALRDLEAAAREAQSRIGDAVDAEPDSDEDDGESTRGAAEAELRRLEEIMQRMMRGKSAAAHEHKAVPMRCPHCGEEFDPAEREPDGDPDDKGCDPKDEAAKAASDLPRSLDELTAENGMYHGLDIHRFVATGNHEALAARIESIDSDIRQLERDQARPYANGKPKGPIHAAEIEKLRAVRAIAAQEHGRMTSGGDVQVRDYERDGHTVHGYSRRRPGGKSIGGRSAHLLYS